MKTLFLRELRRLMPYGLAGLVCLLGSFFLELAQPRWWPATLPPAVFLGLVPAFLGVAAVAPDTGSGGTAFLARLPLNPGRALAVKVAAAGSWTILGVGIFGICMLVLRVDLGVVTRWEAIFQLVAITSFGFGAGLVASVMAHRTMPALLLAPCLAVGTALGAVAVPTVLLDMYDQSPEYFLSGALGSYSVVLVGLAFLAYVKGDRHRRSPRPAGLAIGGLLATLVLGLGTTSVAHAWTVASAVPELTVHHGAVGNAETVAVQLGGPCWAGRQQRIAVIDRKTQETWVVPTRGAWRPELSPDGRRLVLWNHFEPLEGWLADLDERRITPFGDFGLDPRNAPSLHCLWREGGLLILAVRGEQAWLHDPGEEREASELSLPEGSRFLGTDPQGHVLVWDARRIHTLTLTETARVTRTETRLWPLEGELAQVVLSPSGRYALCQPTRQQLGPVVWELVSGHTIRLDGLGKGRDPRDIAQDRERAKGLHLADYRGSQHSLGVHAFGFSPGERHLLIERSGGRAALADLKSGSVRTYEPERSSLPGIAVAWSSDGRLGTLPSGLTIDTTTGEVVAHERVAAYVTPDLTVRPGQPLQLLSREGLEGGAQ